MARLSRRVLNRAEAPLVAALFCEVFNAPPWSDGWTADAAGARIDGMLASPSAFGVIRFAC